MPKKARGLMAKYLIQHQVEHLDFIKEFNEAGYQFHAATSTETNFDFIRHL